MKPLRTAKLIVAMVKEPGGLLMPCGVLTLVSSLYVAWPPLGIAALGALLATFGYFVNDEWVKGVSSEPGGKCIGCTTFAELSPEGFCVICREKKL